VLLRVRRWTRSSAVRSNPISERLFSGYLVPRIDKQSSIDTRPTPIPIQMVHIYFRYMAYYYTIVEETYSNDMRLQPVPGVLRRLPDGDGLSKPVSVVDSIDDRRVVDTERVYDTHGGQTVDANARLSVNVKDLFLAADPIGAVAGGTVVIGEEAVQARSKDEDVARLRDVQAPRSFLSTREGWIFPLRERSIERTRWRRVRLEIRRLSLRKAEVMVRRSGEVVINEDVMLRPRTH